MTSTRYMILALSMVTEMLLSRRTVRGASRRCLTLEKVKLTAFGAAASGVHGSRDKATRRLEGNIAGLDSLIEPRTEADMKRLR